MRTILLHVNAEVADEYDTAQTEKELFWLLQMAGDDPDNCPALASGTVVIALAEEI